MSTDYRIVLRGRVPDRMLNPYLEEFNISRTNTTTTLAGPIIDASQLHGIVTHLTATGLDIVELSSPQTPSDPEQGSPQRPVDDRPNEGNHP